MKRTALSLQKAHLTVYNCQIINELFLFLFFGRIDERNLNI